MSVKPLVSIVIPAYNSAKFIRETLDACLSQTYTDTEIIVIDDGSHDKTVSIVQSYGDKIHLIQQANSGPAIARNTGIDAARGDYIQFCDSDDILHPAKIQRSMDLLLKHPDAALVYCQMQPVDEQGSPVNDVPVAPDNSYFETENLFCKMLHANGSPIQTSTILARKSCLTDAGMYRADPDHRCAEDWDLLLRLADKYRFVGIPEILVNYRVREGALTTDTLAMAEGRLKTVQYARHYTKRVDCINDSEYDFFEAGRYHLLAVKLWQQGNNADARAAFLTASKLTPRSATLRRLYAYMSYFLPYSAMDWLNKLLNTRS